MTTQHTPGRALLDEDEPIVRGEDGERIANCYRILDGDPAKTPEETGMANARRVAAAWNACEGMPTTLLEASALHEITQNLLIAKVQRDELLEALKSVLNWIDDNCETTGFDAVEAQADAAIAKAEGGAA